jgi:hypothetical protein
LASWKVAAPGEASPLRPDVPVGEQEAHAAGRLKAASRLDAKREVPAEPRAPDWLEKIELSTMKGLTDLSAIAAAPNLRRLAIDAMPQLTAESFRCLVGHPAPAELWAHTGKSRVNEAVKCMFPGIAR